MTPAITLFRTAEICGVTVLMVTPVFRRSPPDTRQSINSPRLAFMADMT